MPKMLNVLDMTNNAITNLPAPVAAGDAVRKSYVDALAQGLSFKEPARAATTGNLVATRTANVLTADANGALSAIDGVPLVVSDRVLVKNQSTGADNGVYTVTDVGSGGTPYILTRATDFDVSGEVKPGSYLLVTEGTANGDTSWVLSTDAPITLNTTALVFVLFSTAASANAGLGLVQNGNALDVNVDNTTIEINADTVRVKANGISSNELATNSVIAAKIATDAVTSIKIQDDAVTAAKINADVAGLGITQAAGGELDVNVGTGIAISGDAVVLAAAYRVKQFAGNIGDGSTTNIQVNHALASSAVVVQVKTVATGLVVMPDVTVDDANNVTFGFAVAPSTNQYHVTILAAA